MAGTSSNEAIHVPESGTNVSTILLRPENARAFYVLAHGAGAGMRHAFMEAISEALATRGIATLRYQFPYMEGTRGRIDPQPILLATVRAAVEKAREIAPDLPLIAGGKSMGGRMTTNSAAQGLIPDARGIALLGFPLHPAGAPAITRAEHLDRVEAPMLFLQGTRDALAEWDLIEPVCARLGARATLERIEGADHSFHVLKRSGRTDAQVLDQLADSILQWSARLAQGSAIR